MALRIDFGCLGERVEMLPFGLKIERARLAMHFPVNTRERGSLRNEISIF